MGNDGQDNAKQRREYGSGSLYQRKADWRWIGSVEAGWNANGTRRRIPVTGKGCVGGCKKRCHHRTAINKKLRDKKAEVDSGELITPGNDQTTIKTWGLKYLELRKQPPKALSPNGWNAAASPIRKWIIPTIGHKRLANLTPADRRAVAQAQYDAGNKTSAADATDRQMMTMLTWAIKEGYKVPQQVMAADSPGMGESDRTDIPIADAVACLEVASWLPHGIRWLLTLLYGVRQGEALGLIDVDPIDGEPIVDFDAKVIRLAWQLQDLQREHGCVESGERPTCGKKRGASCPKARWRIPRDYVAVQLKGMYHLVRPKSKQGTRVLPMYPAVEDGLRDWLKLRPKNPYGLYFPTLKGTPSNDKNDREEWRAIQYTASVKAAEVGEYAKPRERIVFHPEGKRFFHIHECRNLAATGLDEVGASENVIMSMLGHADILTSRGYMTAHLDAKRDAVGLLAERLGLPAGGE